MNAMIEEILELMNESPVNLTMLHRLIEKMNEVDIAETFEFLSKEKTIQVFRFLPKSVAAEVFSYIVPEKQQIIVEALTDTEVGKIIDELFVDDAVDFIEEMPANVVKRVLQNVNEDKRKLINQFLQYPDDSAGSIMTTEYIDLREYSNVSEAFETIRSIGINKETIYTCFVIRRDRLLVGVVSAKTLLLSRPEDRISDIMDTNPIFAHTTDDQEEIAALFKRYGLLSLPVVDKEQRLVGIVTVDDIVQVIEEENTEDFERMAALTPSEEPYMKTGVFQHSHNRIFWLMFLMLSATITGSIIDRFQDALLLLPALYFFVPMLMNTGGSAGTQTSTLVIRGLALGEIETSDVMKVFWREVRIGALCGIVLGIVNFIRVYFMHGKDLLLCITLTVSLVFTMMLSKSVGCILPLAAKKIGLDPALMATPFITTIVDATSLLIYFYVASLVFKI